MSWRFRAKRWGAASIATDNIISVLATASDDSKTVYSNFGRARVDLGAPGGLGYPALDSERILGIRANSTSANISDRYSFLAGTSQATPHVTGALALVKSQFPWENYLGLRDRVLMGVDRIVNPQTGLLFLQDQCRTNGRLNLFKALQTRSMFRNLSTRARVENGDRKMIGGFQIGSANPAAPGMPGSTLRLLIRAMGPSIPVSAPLMNPTMTLHGPGINRTQNDSGINDLDPAERAEIASYHLLPNDSREPAMIVDLPSGAYTVEVDSQDGDFGIGSFEIYELSSNSNERCRLLNLSTRCLVGTGDNVAIAGTLVGNFDNTGLPKPDRRVLVRGMGPTLADFGVQGTLADPQLALAGTTQSNDNWRNLDDDSGSGHALEDKLSEAGLAPGHDVESIVWPTFAPASTNTVILSSVNGAIGIGLLELYEY